MLLRLLLLLSMMLLGPRLGAEEWASVQKLLDAAVADGAFPGCSAAVGWGEDEIWLATSGYLDGLQSQPVTRETIYDLASLTKVVGTTSVAMKLLDQQAYSLDDPVARWIPEFTAEADASDPRHTVTIRHLLRHTSGLPSWRPYDKDVDSYREMITRVASTPLIRRPGEKSEYSDLGMILLGEVLARIGKKPLVELEQELVFRPLRMTQTLRNPPEALVERIAPTERVPNLGVIRGVVHDENARAAEGLTGHAGLFSTADDLAILARELLRASRGQSEWLSQRTVEQFIVAQQLPGGARRGLGWQGYTAGGSGGTLLSDTAFGHTGFTGTSLWIDPERELFLILLTNRVHPTRANAKIASVRRAFADAAVNCVPKADSP
jgi:CubicO group peptidase (beta-lactamase class C family)